MHRYFVDALDSDDLYFQQDGATYKTSHASALKICWTYYFSKCRLQLTVNILRFEPVNFFFRGYVKDTIYATLSQNERQLRLVGDGGFQGGGGNRRLREN